MTDPENTGGDAADNACTECERLEKRLAGLLEYLRQELEPSLSSVLGMAGLLQDSGLNGEQAVYLRNIRDAAEGMELVLRGLNDMAWRDTHSALGGEGEFDLRVLVHDMVEFFRIQARRGSIHFKALVDDAVPSLVRGIPGILRRLMGSCLTRALEAPKGSVVLLHLGLVSRTGGAVTLRLQISVDAQIVEPDADFLLVCQELAGRQSGQAGFEASDETCTFWVTFTLPELEARPASFPPPAPIAGQRILVVDTDATWRSVMREYCYLWECRFAEAVDGGTALEQMRKDASLGETHDFVLVGSNLGSIGPEEFGHEVRRDGALAGAMLVVLASAARPGDAARMAGAGYDGFLSRPLDQRRLHDTLCLILGARLSGEKVGLVTRHVVAEERKRRKRIMVACGNVPGRENMAQILTRGGFVFDTVGTGEDALRLLRDHSYSLLFVGEDVGGMDLMDLARLIRDPSSGLDGDMPAIVVSNGLVPPEQYVTAGFTEVMLKPLDIQSVFSRLEKYVQPNEPGKGDAGAPALDVDRLLEQLDHDRDLLTDVLHTFLSEGRARIGEFMITLELGDFTKAEQKANALRGVASNIRAEGVRILAEMAEQACRRANLEKARGLGEELLRELGRVEQAAVLV